MDILDLIDNALHDMPVSPDAMRWAPPLTRREFREHHAGVVVDRPHMVSSELAADAGFTVPVKVSGAAWQDCVAWEQADSDRLGIWQDEAGRLWDVVWVASRRLLRCPSGGTFEILRFRANAEPGEDAEAEPVRLRIRVTSGLATISLASETEGQPVTGPGDTCASCRTPLTPEDTIAYSHDTGLTRCIGCEGLPAAGEEG